MNKTNLKSFARQADDKVIKFIETKGSKDPFCKKKYEPINFLKPMTISYILEESSRFDIINNFVDKQRIRSDPLIRRYRLLMDLYLLFRNTAFKSYFIAKKLKS